MLYILCHSSVISTQWALVALSSSLLKCMGVGGRKMCFLEKVLGRDLTDRTELEG